MSVWGSSLKALEWERVSVVVEVMTFRSEWNVHDIKHSVLAYGKWGWGRDCGR